MIEAVSSVYGHYFDFSERASRAEYWWFAIFLVVLEFICFFLGAGGLIALLAISFASIIPGWAVFVRRLHDTNRSGWWWLAGFIPLVGGLLLLVLTLLPGTEGPNNYGLRPTH